MSTEQVKRVLLATGIFLWATSIAHAQITQIIDASGDGMGATLQGAHGLAVDSLDNVYVTGSASDNVFQITPGGDITEILDASGNVYVCGIFSDNAFSVVPFFKDGFETGDTRA